jgi:hypothetical protein
MIGNSIPHGGTYHPLSTRIGPTGEERRLAEHQRVKDTQRAALHNLAGQAHDAEDLRMLMDILDLPITLLEV